MRYRKLLSAILVFLLVACLKKNCDDFILPVNPTPLPPAVCLHKITGWENTDSVSINHFNRVFFLNNKTGWIAGYNGEILKTTDGGATFTLQNSGTTRMIVQIHFLDEDTGYAVGGTSNPNGMVLKTTNGGALWTTVLDNTDAIRCMYFFNKDTGIVGSHIGAISKTTDGGKTWKKITSGIPPTASLYNMKFINHTGYACGANGLILKSTDKGENWASIINDLPQGGNDAYFGLDIMDENICYFGGYTKSSNKGYIARTTDGGKSFTYSQVNDFQFMGMLVVNKDTAFAVGGEHGIKGGIYKTANGTDWNLEKSVQDILVGISFIGCDKAIASGYKGFLVRGN